MCVEGCGCVGGCDTVCERIWVHTCVFVSMCIDNMWCESIYCVTLQLSQFDNNFVISCWVFQTGINLAEGIFDIMLTLGICGVCVCHVCLFTEILFCIISHV